MTEQKIEREWDESDILEAWVARGVQVNLRLCCPSGILVLSKEDLQAILNALDGD